MKKNILCLVAVILALSGCSGAKGNNDVEYETSIEFVNAMGLGWNLGNTFDCTGEHGDNPADYEKAWGNPETTKELIHFIKSEGFDPLPF